MSARAPFSSTVRLPEGIGMGMRLALCSIDAENLRKVLADPPLVWRVIAPDDPEAYERARPRGSLLKKVLGAKDGPVQELALLEGEVQSTDLDKAWHGIHYLLTGTAYEGEGPVSYLLTGGVAVGDVDVGYGPARALTPAEVHDFQQALTGLATEELRARFNPAEMTALEIYPDIWDRDPAEDDTLQYCLEYFETLRNFVGIVASKNQGLLIYVS
jgi:hypothetical protein